MCDAGAARRTIGLRPARRTSVLVCPVAASSRPQASDCDGEAPAPRHRHHSHHARACARTGGSTSTKGAGDLRALHAAHVARGQRPRGVARAAALRPSREGARLVGLHEREDGADEGFLRRHLLVPGHPNAWCTEATQGLRSSSVWRAGCARARRRRARPSRRARGGRCRRRRRARPSSCSCRCAACPTRGAARGSRRGGRPEHHARGAVRSRALQEQCCAMADLVRVDHEDNVRPQRRRVVLVEVAQRVEREVHECCVELRPVEHA